MPQEVHPLLVPELAQLLDELTTMHKKQEELLASIDKRLRLYGLCLQWDEKGNHDFVVCRISKKGLPYE